MHLGALLGLAVAAWFSLLWLRGTPVSWDHFWPFGFVLSLLVLTVGAFERWWWSWRCLQGWFVLRPDLRGTWRVKIESEWRNRQRRAMSQPVHGYMVIRQSLTTLNMRLITPESSSRIEAHRVVREEDGVYKVAAVFVNEPKLELRGKRSEIHYGAMILQILGGPPTSLEGHYWTDRDSRGAMTVVERIPKLCSGYAEAETAFGRG